MEYLKSRRLGILWSHNKRVHPYWLRTCIRACKGQGFIWWDVGWKINFNQFKFPIEGYIWNTVKKVATHTTWVLKESRSLHQPEIEPAERAYENLRELKVHVNENSPLLEYIRGERENFTLLKLGDLRRLSVRRKLADFRLWNGRPILQPPQNYRRILLS